MEHTIQDRTLALAGTFQAAYLVHQIATQGMTDTAALEASINSIFKVDADSVEEVFGDINGVITGLSVMKRQLSNDRHRYDMQITQYVVAILHLSKKLQKRPQVLQQIAEGIQGATEQAQVFHNTHENVIARLADIYQNTVSTIPPKIMVQGQHGHLSNPNNASKVRAILLAGIRSGILWMQCGGARWQVLLKRKAYVTEAIRILALLRQ